MKKLPHTWFSTGLRPSARMLRRRLGDLFSSPRRRGTLPLLCALLCVGLLGSLVACDGEPAGGIRVQTLSPGRYRFAPLFVHPEYQGRGIARQALPLAEALCPGALSWQLETILEEPRLCRFYESLGYVATGEEEEVPDSFLTLVHYRKDA